MEENAAREPMPPPMYVKLPRALDAEVRRMAQDEERTISAVLRRLVIAGLSTRRPTS